MPVLMVLAKNGKRATTATKLFYKLEAQRVPSLSPDVRGPNVHSQIKITFTGFFFEGLVCVLEFDTVQEIQDLSDTGTCVEPQPSWASGSSWNA